MHDLVDNASYLLLEDLLIIFFLYLVRIVESAQSVLEVVFNETWFKKLLHATAIVLIDMQAAFHEVPHTRTLQSPDRLAEIENHCWLLWRFQFIDPLHDAAGEHQV